MQRFKLTVILSIILVGAVCAQNKQLFELDKINFEGNSAFSDGELYSVIYSKETPVWFLKFLDSFSGFGEAPVYFDSLLINSDIELMKNLYVSRGYFKVKIKYNYSYDIENGTVDLNYFISENEPVKFNKLLVKGLDKVTGEIKNQLSEILVIDTTAEYSAEFVENTYLQVIALLKDHGYMLAQSLKPVVEVDTTKNTAEITYDFRLGNKYQINDIRVSKSGPGKEYVQDDLLKEIVDIKPGDTYSSFDNERAQIRLYRTNLFSSALVTAVVSDTAGSNVPLSVSVDVDKMHELSPEIITNNEDNSFNLGIGLGFTRKNFLGSARKLSINTSAAAQNLIDLLSNLSVNDTSFLGYADGRIAMEQPFLFGKPINTKLETYYTLQKRKNEYNSKIYGSKLSLDFELPQYTYFTSFTTFFNWESAEYIYKRSYISSSLKTAFSRTFDSGTVVDSLVNYYMDSVIVRNNYKTDNTTIGFELGANHSNSITFPTRGYSLALSIEDGNSIPFLINKIQGKDFASPEYVKAVINSSFYFPVSRQKSSVIALKMKVGDIFTYRGSRANISLNQRFYAGGSNSIRGWSSRELVPQDPEVDISAPNENFNSILLRGISPGGFFIIESSIELRQKLGKSLGYAAFLDVGNTWNEPQSFRYDELASAGGFGLRIYTSFVPIRLDFGFKLYDPQDRRSIAKRLNDQGGFWNIFQFHLGIGEAF